MECNLKAVILAGGYGTRLGGITTSIPKPMVEIGGQPILTHIMETYSRYDVTEFVVAAGYKANVIKQYFAQFNILRSDFFVDLRTGVIEPYFSGELSWKVGVFDTGLDVMTGGRLKRLKPLLGDGAFCVTYGDGLGNVDIEGLIAFHKSHGKLVTMTVVRPPARFGEVYLGSRNEVFKFEEKPQLVEGWINGGFFVIEPEFLDQIAGDATMLEREPLEWAVENGELMAFQHHGFWQCMDTPRDKTYLDDLAARGECPWRPKN